MSCDHGHNPKLGWLEVVQEEGSAEGTTKQMAFCPYRDRAIDAAICYACKDCSGLALSPMSRRYFVVCDRAATDGMWVEGGTDARPPLIHRCCTCGSELDGAPKQA